MRAVHDSAWTGLLRMDGRGVDLGSTHAHRGSEYRGEEKGCLALTALGAMGVPVHLDDWEESRQGEAAEAGGLGWECEGGGRVVTCPGVDSNSTGPPKYTAPRPSTM